MMIRVAYAVLTDVWDDTNSEGRTWICKVFMTREKAIAYADQRRSEFDPNTSLWENQIWRVESVELEFNIS